MTHLLKLIPLLLIALPSLANLNQEMKQCRQIEAEADRLSCYDKLTLDKEQAKLDSPAALSPSQVTSTTPSLPKQAPAKAQIQASTNNNNQPATNQQAKSQTNDIDSFGQDASQGIQRIQSKMLGQFKRWEKGMLLKLENGQVWKVLTNRSGYKKMENPLITISKGVFGSFDARVEGLNAKAKVKRIK